MRAILINPENQTVTEIDQPEGLQAIYDALECTTISCPHIGSTVYSIYCDEEALFKPSGFAYRMDIHHSPLIGKGLILDCNEDGETIGTDADIGVISQSITWLGEQQF